MSGEPDSGTGPGSSTTIKLLEPPALNHSVIKNNNNNTNINNNIDDTDCDMDKVTASTNSASNFDTSDTKILLKCERCDSFETISRTLLLVHVAQCNGTSGRTHNALQQIETSNATIGGLQSAAVSVSVTTVPIQSGTDTTQAGKHRKLFECDVCNMKFSNGANMRRHKMRHTGVKPYECRVCQKRFFRKDHLAEHFTTHTKTLPFHCPVCNRGFQRQIAMRAHFQNEHVGQHDLVKTCPLCSYRAGTMKSLRVHFFNRHGIDLDNPGPNGPSSLLLALDPQNAAFLPNLASAAASGLAGQSVVTTAYSDSGDSLRSAENGTPPMHFLTPHVEISMADNDTFKNEPTPVSSALEIQPCLSNRPNGGSPASPHSADSNSNAPTSSQSLIGNVLQNTRHLLIESQITPSISLIPIKQEPNSDDYNDGSKTAQQRPFESATTSPSPNIIGNSTESASPSSSLTSLIKVSPLKSLLREDLKRRISARAGNRSASSRSQSSTSTTTITNNIEHHSIPSSITVTTEPSPSPSGLATTSNGIITSTGPETEILLPNRKRMLQCLFCGIEFPDQTLYFLHKGCHSESNPWKCNICGEQCNNVYEFNSHLLSKSHQ